MPPLTRDYPGSFKAACGLINEMLFDMEGVPAPEGEHYHYETATVYACRHSEVRTNSKLLRERGYGDTRVVTPACDNVRWFAKRAARICGDGEE